MPFASADDMEEKKEEKKVEKSEKVEKPKKTVQIKLEEQRGNLVDKINQIIEARIDEKFRYLEERLDKIEKQINEWKVEESEQETKEEEMSDEEEGDDEEETTNPCGEDTCEICFDDITCTECVNAKLERVGDKTNAKLVFRKCLRNEGEEPRHIECDQDEQ